MNTAFFIAAKMIKSGTLSKRGTATIIRLSIAGIALGVGVMILSIAIVTGFQNVIRSKVVGFGCHLTIKNYTINQGTEESPLEIDSGLINRLEDRPEVKNVQSFINRVGILKTQEELAGVYLKGVGPDFNWDFFEAHLTKGKIPTLSKITKNDSILISERLSQKLDLDLNDKTFIYLVKNNKPRPRKFYVSGIYNTGMAEMDEKIVIVDMTQLRKINGWDENQVSGLDVNLNSYKDLEQLDGLKNRLKSIPLNAVSIREAKIKTLNNLT